jgi:hypothetical protein
MKETERTTFVDRLRTKPNFILITPVSRPADSAGIYRINKKPTIPDSSCKPDIAKFTQIGHRNFTNPKGLSARSL